MARTPSMKARPDAAGEARPVSWRACVPVVLAAWALFTFWALVVPPYQVADEVQHALRAGSVLEQPWVAGGDFFIVDQRHANPIAREPGPQLGKLFFLRQNALTREDVTILKARRWDEKPIVPEVVREVWAGASYPPPFHLAVFAVAQPVIRTLALTPYQATYACRLAVVFLAGLLWGVAYRQLTREFARAEAARILAFVLSIPMLVFPSSGVHPDAVVYPLAMTATLACWRVVRTGRGRFAAFGFVLATALVKPVGLPLALALSAAALMSWALGRTSSKHAAAVVTSAAGAVLLAYAAFYAWSPPRFLSGGPIDLSLQAWLWTVVQRAPVLWKMFWGWLGWLDYTLPPWWYKVLAGLVAVNAVACWRTLRTRDMLVYLPFVLGVFILVHVAGEFVYLTQTGLNLQGRHFIPAVIGLAPLLVHPYRAASLGLQIFVAAMHVAFVSETVVRYYGGDWRVVYAALPWT